MKRKSAGVIGVAVTVCLFCGCGGGDSLGRKAISGTVNVDGAPVQEGNISFEPIQGTTSAGAPIAAGKYAIEQAKGLPPGKYRVMINAPVPGTGGKVDPNALPGDAVPVPEELIPAEWNSKSEQSIEVKSEGPFEFNFDVKTKK